MRERNDKIVIGIGGLSYLPPEYVSIDFLLTVKAAVLIFISGRGSAIHLLKKGNRVLFIIW